MTEATQEIVGAKAIAEYTGMTVRQVWDLLRHPDGRRSLGVQSRPQGRKTVIFTTADRLESHLYIVGMEAVARYLDIPIGRAYELHRKIALPKEGWIIRVRPCDLRRLWSGFI